MESNTFLWREIHNELKMVVEQSQPCSQVMCVTCTHPFRDLHCTKCNTCYEERDNKLVPKILECPCCSIELTYKIIDLTKRVRFCPGCNSEWTLQFNPHTSTLDLVDKHGTTKWCYAIPQPQKKCPECDLDCDSKTYTKEIRKFLNNLFLQRSSQCYSWVNKLDRLSALLIFETAGMEGNLEVLKWAYSTFQFNVYPPPPELIRSIILDAVEKEDTKVIIQLRCFQISQDTLRDAFVLAAEHKSLTMMKFLRSRLALNIEEMMDDHKALLHCVKNQDLTGFCWLKKKVNYSVVDLSYIFNRCDFVNHVRPCFLELETGWDWEAFLYHNKVKETQKYLMAKHFPTLQKQLKDIIKKGKLLDLARRPSFDPTTVDDWLRSLIPYLTQSLDLLKWALTHSTLKDGHYRNSTLKDGTYQSKLFKHAVFGGNIQLLDFITDYFNLDSSHFLDDWHLWPVETVVWALERFKPTRLIACDLIKDTMPKVAKVVFDHFDWADANPECVYAWYDTFPDKDFYHDACHGSIEFIEWLVVNHPDSYEDWLRQRKCSILVPVWKNSLLNQGKAELRRLHLLCPLNKSEIVTLCEYAEPHEFKFLYKLYKLDKDDFSQETKLDTLGKFLMLDNIPYLQWIQDQWQMPASTYQDELEFYSADQACWFEFNFSLRQRIQACLPLNNDFWSARFVCTGVIILKNAASSGDLEVAQWAIKTFSLGGNLQRITQMERTQIMLAAMKHENVQLLQYLYNFLELEPEHVEDYLPFCTGPQACAWLHSVVHYFKESSTVKNTWETAKVFKRESVLQWIQDVFHYQEPGESLREQLKKDLVSGRAVLNEQVVDSLPQFQQVCKLITDTDPDSFLSVALVCYFRAKFVVSQ